MGRWDMNKGILAQPKAKGNHHFLFISKVKKKFNPSQIRMNPDVMTNRCT